MTSYMGSTQVWGQLYPTTRCASIRLHNAKEYAKCRRCAMSRLTRCIRTLWYDSTIDSKLWVPGPRWHFSALVLSAWQKTRDTPSNMKANLTHEAREVTRQFQSAKRISCLVKWSANNGSAFGRPPIGSKFKDEKSWKINQTCCTATFFWPDVTVSKPHQLHCYMLCAGTTRSEFTLIDRVAKLKAKRCSAWEQICYIWPGSIFATKIN